MSKIIILSQIGADRYQKLIFKILFLTPLGELWPGVNYAENIKKIVGAV